MTSARVAAALAAWERAEDALGKLGPRRENDLVATADKLLRACLTERADVDELLALLNSTDRHRLREWLRSRVLPDVAGALEDPAVFRSHPLVGFSAEVMPFESSLALPEVPGTLKDRDLFADEEYPGELSWLAGCPVAGADDEWPVGPDGAPLAHVVEVDLQTARERMSVVAPELGDLGLPEAGVLQLFHDLEVLGWEPAVDDARSWAVRWVEEPTHVVKRPKHLEKGRYRKEVLVEPAAVISVPASDAVTLDDEDWTRYDRVGTHIEDYLRSPLMIGEPEADEPPSAWEDAHRSSGPTSRVGGFGFHAWTPEVAAALAVALPLEGADDHVLVFDVAGVRHLDGWFGDAGSLQAWMRRTDLVERRFDRVWCLMRMD